MTKKQRKFKLAIALIITIFIVAGVLLRETRFMASYEVMNLDQKASCSRQNPYPGQIRVFCVQVTEVQRFFAQGSRSAEYDIRVYTDPTLSLPEPRTISRKNIFAPYEGRIDPGKLPYIEWRKDGLLIRQSSGVLANEQKQDPRLKLDSSGQAFDEFFLPASEFVY